MWVLVVILLLLMGTPTTPVSNRSAWRFQRCGFRSSYTFRYQEERFDQSTDKGSISRLPNKRHLSVTNPGQVDFPLVQVKGFEPSIHHRHRILSPTCMPVPTHLHILLRFSILFYISNPRCWYILRISKRFAFKEIRIMVESFFDKFSFIFRYLYFE